VAVARASQATPTPTPTLTPTPVLACRICGTMALHLTLQYDAFLPTSQSTADSSSRPCLPL